MDKRKITGREVLKDIRIGMDDPALMEKYKLSAQGLQSVFMKLVNAGLLSRAELDSGVPVSERTVEIGLYICPACGNIQAKEFTQCSRCGFISPNHMNQQREKEEPAKTRSKSTAAKVHPKTQRYTRSAKPEPIESSDYNPSNSDDHIDEAPVSLKAIVRYGNGLAVAALITYALVVLGLIGILQTSPATEFLTAVQLLLGALILIFPALITGLVVFLAVRALTESVKVLMISSKQLGKND